MLQIITGRFFGPGIVNQQEYYAILYSNYSWINPTITCVGELIPIDTYSSRISSYTFRYNSLYQPSSESDPLVQPKANDAVEQFRLLVSFYLNAYFHVDRAYVEDLCRTRASHHFDDTFPSAFVPKLFELERRGTQEEAIGLTAFLEKVICMPRKQYRLLMNCLAGYFGAMEAIGQNFDLAYSMMVYVLEALSKSIDQPSPSWDDYDQEVKRKLDIEFQTVNSDVANSVRKILLGSSHVKLMKRFVSFIEDHTKESFFIDEAKGLGNAIPKSEYSQALKNLYASRSGYVHELRQVQEHLRHNFLGNQVDVFSWSNQPHLTFAGLARLSRHVIQTFIELQPAHSSETYPNWRNEMSGIIQAELAPEYWVARSDTFQSEQARHRLSGFISHLISHYSKHTILDLRDLLIRIEELASSAKPLDRVAMLSMYIIFNASIRAEFRRPNWNEFANQWDKELELCCIEMIVTHLILRIEFPWQLKDTVDVFERYQKSKFKENATRLPRLAEIGISSAIANKYLAIEEKPEFEKWIQRAILDAAGMHSAQDYLRECSTLRKAVDVERLMGRSSTKVEELKSNSNEDEINIRIAAYSKWESLGRPNIDSVQIWLEAEKDYRERTT